MTSPRSHSKFIQSLLGLKLLISAVKDVPDKTTAGQNIHSADEEVETGLPLDIWYFIAHDYLIDSSATIAALCLTCRRLNHMLGFLKYRAVSITLTCTTHSAEAKAKSSAERFAEKLRIHHEIVDHLVLLRIRQDGDGELQAFEPSSNAEQTSLCYLLTRPYPVLKVLTLSIKCAPTFPLNVLDAFRTCFCLPSLSDVSLLDLIPVDLLNELQQQNHTLNLIGYVPPPKSPPVLADLQRRYAPQTLRIAHEHTTRSLFFFDDQPMLGLERLTTLSLKSSASYVSVNITDFCTPCSATLTTLEVLFTGWSDGHGEPDSLVLFLGNYAVLKTLTLKFNSLQPSPKTIRQGLEWTIETLSTFIGIEPPPRLESLNYNLFMGDLQTEKRWADKVNSISWGNFQTLFSPDWIFLRWPTLQQILVNIKVPTQGKYGLDYSDVNLIEGVLRSKLADLVQSGHLKLSVTDSSMGFQFDEWCRF